MLNEDDVIQLSFNIQPVYMISEGHQRLALHLVCG